MIQGIAPWRIGTLKYFEMKIEKWPSRAKWVQAGQKGPNGAKHFPMSAISCYTLCLALQAKNLWNATKQQIRIDNLMRRGFRQLYIDLA